MKPMKAGYEFIDHPADVHVHAFGSSLAVAFEQCVYALMKTMTDPEKIDNFLTHEWTMQEDERGALLVSFLSDFLFIFDTEALIFSHIKIDQLNQDPQGVWHLHAVGLGEKFNPNKHFQDTEVKAITYSYLNIEEKPGRVDIDIIYDV